MIALDNAGNARPQREKLSTIFVDNTVDGFCKDKVSGVAKSIFCSAIKKYAPRFRICIQTLAFEGRMAARFAGYSRYRFVTIVDEGRRQATHGGASKTSGIGQTIQRKRMRASILRQAHRSAAALLD